MKLLMVKLMALGRAEPWSQVNGRVQAVKGIGNIVAFPSARKKDELAVSHSAPWILL